MLIEVAEPFDEGCDFGIAPHPGREALKVRQRLVRVTVGADSLDEAVDPVGIRPVPLHGDEVEAVLRDQTLGDGCPLLVELVCPM